MQRLTGLQNLQPNVSEERVFEARIAIQLNAGQAIFSEQLNRLYFHDALDKPIAQTVRSVLTGMGYRAPIEPILIDEHRFMAVGSKVYLDPAAYLPVSTALLLIGVKIERQRTEIIRRAAL